MKTKIFALFLLVVCSFSLSAQQRVIKVFGGGAVLFQKPTAEMDSIKSDGSTLFFHYDGGSLSFLRSDVDSVTFADIQDVGGDTADVDTTSMVTVEWNNGNVTVTNPYANQGLTIMINGETVVASSSAGIADIVYRLKGSSTNGSFAISTDKKFVLLLDGLNLASSVGPAIFVASDYRCLVHLADGTVNSLADGPSNNGKGALQSVGRFVIQGGGTLNVLGNVKHGIQSSGSTTITSGVLNILGAVKDGMNVDNFIMQGGTVNVVSSGDGIDGDQGYIDISGGELTITCSGDDAKGLGCDSSLNVSGGEITVTVTGSQSKAIKTKENMTVSGGSIEVHADGTVVMEESGSGYDPSFCTGIKVNGVLRVFDGSLDVSCSSSNSGGKAISCDGDIFISGGTISLTATGGCVKYLDPTGVYTSYSSTCLKSDANITVSGGQLTAVAGGRAISADGNYTQTGGNVITSTNAVGFTTIGSGTSCTDGFASACLKSDGHIQMLQGSFSGTSTGKGGRGIVGDSTLTIGTIGAADSLLHIYVTTSGAPVNASSGGGWPGGGGGSSDYWKGLPKGIKIQDTIRIYSGVLQSYCSQTSGSTTGEALESKSAIIIYGGVVETNAYDDAINAGTYLEINNGKVWAYSRGNDAIDCNGTTIYINGGTIVCRGSETGFDDNADRGGHMYVTGGTIVAVGGNMGAIEGTPTVTNQKYLVLSSSSGGGWPGGGGGGSTLATNGFCVKNNDATEEILTFKWTNASGNGFQMSASLPEADPRDNNMVCKLPADIVGGGSKAVSGIFITTPDVQSGTYRYYTSPTITGGTNWHGIYDGATVTTSGNGTTTTAR